MRPETSWSPAEGSFGALEIKARVGQLSVDDDTFPVFASSTESAATALALGGGFNWYFARNLRLSAEIEQTTLEDIGGEVMGEPEIAGTVWMQVSY